MNVSGGGSISGSGDVVLSTFGVNLQNSNNVKARNFSMGPGATLQALTNSIILTGNYSFQQTDPLNAWNTNGTPGLGPNVFMTGGPSVQTLEVGGVNEGPIPAGFVNNFALNSLTIYTGSSVQLVDQYPNATPSGWTSGSEALYLNSLNYSGVGDPVLDLNGIMCYVYNGGTPIALTDGTYNGITITGAPVPEPGTLALLGIACLAFGCIGYRRARAHFSV